MKLTQSCRTLCDPVDYAEHGLLQAMEWVAFPFSGSFPEIKSRSLTLQADSLPAEPQGKPKNIGVGSLSPPGIEPGVSCIAGRFFTS